MADAYRTLEITPIFLQDFASRDFTTADRRAILKALELLDTNEKHPSLRVHRLQGDREGAWSASASSSFRVTFKRLPEGRKSVLSCSKHYAR